MKQSIKNLTILLVVITSFSFTTINDKGLDLRFGVSNSDPSHIELKLNEDYSFSYIDLSNPKNRIDVIGTYSVMKNKIILQAEDKTASFHDHWKISDEGNTARSRKGLSFYTLRKL